MGASTLQEKHRKIFPLRADPFDQKDQTFLREPSTQKKNAFPYNLSEDSYFWIVDWSATLHLYATEQLFCHLMLICNMWLTQMYIQEQSLNYSVHPITFYLPKSKIDSWTQDCPIQNVKSLTWANINTDYVGNLKVMHWPFQNGFLFTVSIYMYSKVLCTNQKLSFLYLCFGEIL